MFENNTDRMFWTIAVLILGATLLMIGNRAFPKVQSSITQNILATTNIAENSANGISETVANQKPSYPVYNEDYDISFYKNDQGETVANLEHFNGKPNVNNMQIPAWTYNEDLKTNVKVESINKNNNWLGTYSGYGIKSITINSNIKYIGNSAFFGNQITNVRIPSSVRYIKWYGFGQNPLKFMKLSKNTQIDSAGIPNTTNIVRY